VRTGGLFHGLQLWVNLPAADKLSAPRYQDLAADAVGLLASGDGGALVRVIAGTVADHHGPGRTHTPITVVHATVAAAAQLELPWRADFNALVSVMSGTGRVGPDGTALHAGQLAVLGPGELITVQAAAGPASALEVMLLGGRPIREPLAWAGPFVMNTRAEVAQAFEDYRRGRFARFEYSRRGQPPDSGESAPMPVRLRYADPRSTGAALVGTRSPVARDAPLSRGPSAMFTRCSPLVRPLLSPGRWAGSADGRQWPVAGPTCEAGHGPSPLATLHRDALGFGPSPGFPRCAPAP
jgi:hypothetical protein